MKKKKSLVGWTSLKFKNEFEHYCPRPFGEEQIRAYPIVRYRTGRKGLVKVRITIEEI